MTIFLYFRKNAQKIVKIYTKFSKKIAFVVDFG